MWSKALAWPARGNCLIDQSFHIQFRIKEAPEQFESIAFTVRGMEDNNVFLLRVKFHSIPKIPSVHIVTSFAHVGDNLSVREINRIRFENAEIVGEHRRQAPMPASRLGNIVEKTFHKGRPKTVP